MTHDWRLHAAHIVKSAEKVFLIKQRGDISTDEVLYDATLRNLQTLSEATQHLPSHLTSTRPDIPWKEISGFRNILVHNYLGDIDPATIARVVENDIEPLVKAVKSFLKS